MTLYPADLKGPLKAEPYIDPDDVTVIRYDWGAPVFVANTVYREGMICRPTVDNGYYYKVKINGKSAATEPTSWGQVTQVSGTVTFTAVPYDLWVLPGQTLQDGDTLPASAWTATNGVTLRGGAWDATSASIIVDPLPEGVNSFELTNKVRKNTGETLSRSVKYKVNDQ